MLNMTDMIEPREGAEPRVAEDRRHGVHRLFGSDEFCNVWWCVPLNSLGRDGVDKESIEPARRLLHRLKLHADPLLRLRGWRVKHLHEHYGHGPGGMCYHDLQGTADISIRLRAVPGNPRCNAFLPFGRLLGVMLHEVTHISGHGLEDVHPPEFYEELKVVRQQHRAFVADGTIFDPDGGTQHNGGANATLDGRGTAGDGGENNGVDGGCKTQKSRGGGAHGRNRKRGRASGGGGSAATRQLKRLPLGKKQRMLDKRTTEGRRVAAEQAAHATPAEAARAAALARFGHAPLSAAESKTKLLRTSGTSGATAIALDDSEEEEVGGGDSMFAPMPMGMGMVMDDSDACSDGEHEEYDEDEDGTDDLVEAHNGPPGFCDCAACR